LLIVSLFITCYSTRVRRLFPAHTPDLTITLWIVLSFLLFLLFPITLPFDEFLWSVFVVPFVIGISGAVQTMQREVDSRVIESLLLTEVRGKDLIYGKMHFVLLDKGVIFLGMFPVCLVGWREYGLMACVGLEVFMLCSFCIGASIGFFLFPVLLGFKDVIKIVILYLSIGIIRVFIVPDLPPTSFFFYPLLLTPFGMAIGLFHLCHKDFVPEICMLLFIVPAILTLLESIWMLRLAGHILDRIELNVRKDPFWFLNRELWKRKSERGLLQKGLTSLDANPLLWIAFYKVTLWKVLLVLILCGFFFFLIDSQSMDFFLFHFTII